MRNSRKGIEAFVAESFGRRFAVMTSRGASALYLALRSTTKPGAEVVLPGVVCPDVLYAVIYAGLRPVLCDVRSEDFTMSVDSLKAVSSKKTKTAIPVHLFGHPCSMGPILEFAQANDVCVIEDAAQAIGSKYRGKGVGRSGEVSIISFGAGKVVDAGGGGALLTDDEDLADEARRLESALPKYSGSKAEHDAYRRAYYSARDLTDADPAAASKNLRSLPGDFRNLYLYRAAGLSTGRIVAGLETLPENVRGRRRKAKELRESLVDRHILHPEVAAGTNFFRYSFRIVGHGLRQRVVSALRKEGLHVSTLYPSLTPFVEGGRPGLPASELVGKEIVNLWVDTTVDDEYLRRSSAKILEIVKRAS